MENNYNLEIKNDCIYLTLHGIYNYELFLTFSKQLQIECEKNKINKVIINSLNVDKTIISTTERLFIGTNVSSDSKLNLKIATVWKEDEIKQFTTANESILNDNYRIFNSLELAENWLKDLK